MQYTISIITQLLSYLQRFLKKEFKVTYFAVFTKVSLSTKLNWANSY